MLFKNKKLVERWNIALSLIRHKHFALKINRKAKQLLVILMLLCVALGSLVMRGERETHLWKVIFQMHEKWEHVGGFKQGSPASVPHSHWSNMNVALNEEVPLQMFHRNKYICFCIKLLFPNLIWCLGETSSLSSAVFLFWTWRLLRAPLEVEILLNPKLHWEFHQRRHRR